MKEILLRNLNSESKADIVEIVEEYLSRNYVETTNGSTAVEQLIREFRRNEGRTKSEIERLQDQVKEMRGQIRSLTDQNQVYTAKHKAFVNSFNDLINHPSA
ncbi:hypothetical protein [Dyadobacter alkalitolerans]|uniref:hypothetical protein n=1 Tax=Dyadobacter alkalitolerans TaxID=492736 RepID=UPI00040EFCB0|nr:hypothetical protein [Dyadobacter alkalitolerans]